MSSTDNPRHLLEVWDRFGSAQMWSQVARTATGSNRETALQALSELETDGRPTALGALAANRRLADLLVGWRWQAMGYAIAYEGATWQQVGDALGMTRQAAHKGFFAALERQEQLAADHGWTDIAHRSAALREAVEQRDAADLTVRQIAYDAITLDGREAYWPDTDQGDLPTDEEAIEMLSRWLEANPTAWSTSYGSMFVIEFTGDDVFRPEAA